MLKLPFFVGFESLMTGASPETQSQLLFLGNQGIDDAHKSVSCVRPTKASVGGICDKPLTM